MKLTSRSFAKVHGRHLVGGRSPVGLANERLVSFMFPEQPGALRRFLQQLPSTVDISLFHYRNHGGDIGRVLVGFIVPPEMSNDFSKFVENLHYEWKDETD